MSAHLAGKTLLQSRVLQSEAALGVLSVGGKAGNCLRRAEDQRLLLLEQGIIVI